MKNNFFHKVIVLIVLSLISSSTVAIPLEENAKDTNIGITDYPITLQNEVWVDDDYYEGGYNDGHTWGYDAFDRIQNGTDNVSDDGIVYVHEGVYDVFSIENRNDIQITSADASLPIVEGSQDVWDSSLTTPSFVKCVVFVNNSDNVQISEFDIEGLGLTGRSYAVYFNGSSGEISNCIISPNEKGNMNNLGVRAHLNSVLDVYDCTIKNYGRIGIYCRTGTSLNVYNNTIIGPVYDDSDGDYVSYGIEVENLGQASQATIRHNEIYNNIHTGTPTWSSAGIIVDSWRYYEVTEENCTAIIEYNDIHDNMLGVQIIPNDNIHVNRNKIYDNNKYGAVSDPYWDGSSYVDYNLDAINNWWGDSSGPYHSTENPDGLGDNITDFVIFEPWIQNLLPSVEITKPEAWFLYININDVIVLKLPFITNLIIGKIDIEVDAPDCLYGIDEVEFLVNNELKATVSTEPYSWTWDEQDILFLYKVKVIAYDNEGNSAEDYIDVWKIF